MEQADGQALPDELRVDQVIIVDDTMKYEGDWTFIRPQSGKKRSGKKKPRAERRRLRRPSGFFRAKLDPARFIPNPDYATAQYEMGEDGDFYIREEFRL